MMERVVHRPNLQRALKRVRSNKGSPGIDGMTVDDLGTHLREHWQAIREQLLAGTYQPQPVKRQLIPKSGGGMRELGIPTVLDRFIQQATLQVLQSDLDGGFSRHSYGFRPGRNAHGAIREAQRYIQEGRRWVVDSDDDLPGAACTGSICPCCRPHGCQWPEVVEELQPAKQRGFPDTLL